MSYCLTLVASDSDLETDIIDKAKDFAKSYISSNSAGISEADIIWLKPGRAFDIYITQKPDKSQLNPFREAMGKHKIDVFLSRQETRRKKLLIADMDSTILDGESLDIMAALAGVEDKVAPITEKAMAGEIDFQQALKERVALLSGQKEEIISQAMGQISLNPGARKLIQTLANQSVSSVLVSGGFSHFSQWVGAQCGFDHIHCNHLEIVNGRMTGQVCEPVVDSKSKKDLLIHYTRLYELEYCDVMAIGDGANDIPMLEIAGEGLGYKARHKVRRDLVNNIVYGDLTAALYIQGYSSHDIIDK